LADFDFDLFVIGGGSGGVRAARIAAEAGARVGLVEEYRYGGTCVIRGCVPKKLLVMAAGFADAFEDAAGFGWRVGSAQHDWPALIAAKDAEIARLEAAYLARLHGAGVQTFRTRATVTGPHSVRLADGTGLSAAHLLVATGGRPVVPDVPGAELGVTSDQMFDLTTLPPRMLVVGGGYVACEFAGIMNGLGSEVIQLYRGEQVLRGFDDDLRAHVADAMRARGIGLQVGRDVVGIERAGDRLRVRADSGETHDVDLVLFATGRRPNTGGLGLELLGVGLGRDGAVQVDRWSQTAVPSIYAVGDVTGRMALTPVAIADGQAFAETVFAGRPRPVDHRLVPTAIFTRPEAATVGRTEAEAAADAPVEVYETRFRPMQNILAGRDERTLVKLVVERDSRRLAGVHLVGPGSAELVQLAAVALRMGATKEDFDATVAVHPTAAEELVTLRTAARTTS
jgi:glutathione reductase (NADPH)